jgi:flagellar export protein FliJ
MAAFRFRAAAALDLRQKEEQAAGAAMAREQARLAELRATRDHADAARRDAQARAAADARRGTDGASLVWHRNWIVNLSTTVDRLADDCGRQTAVLETAERAWQEARRRRLALERMRDRAWRRYQDVERRRELKEIDELARVRHAVLDDGSGRHARDD